MYGKLENMSRNFATGFWQNLSAVQNYYHMIMIKKIKLFEKGLEEACTLGPKRTSPLRPCSSTANPPPPSTAHPQALGKPLAVTQVLMFGHNAPALYFSEKLN